MPDNLDERFGPVLSPKATSYRPNGWDDWETESPDTLVRLQDGQNEDLRCLTELSLRPGAALYATMRQVALLWVVAQNGDLFYALEESAWPPGSPDNRPVVPLLRNPIGVKSRLKLGHPSLVACRPARIGGEIIYEPSPKNPAGWEINNNSGRYGRDCGRSPQHLENASAEFGKYGILNLFPEFYGD